MDLPVPVQEELARGEDIAHCPSCSLTVVVIYNQVPHDGPTCGCIHCSLLTIATAHLSTLLDRLCTAPKLSMNKRLQEDFQDEGAQPSADAAAPQPIAAVA